MSLSDQMEAEKLRILRAARDGRIHTNEHFRWVIDGEARPQRKAREWCVAHRLIEYTFPGRRVTGYKLTEAGARQLEATEASR